MNFATLNLLNEHGLIISDYNSWWEFTPCLALPGDDQQAICMPLSYQGRHWILLPKSKRHVGNKLRIEGVALTQSGRELFTIVEYEPKDNYSKGLAKFLEKKMFQMIEVEDGKPRVVRINGGGGLDSQ